VPGCRLKPESRIEDFLPDTFSNAFVGCAVSSFLLAGAIRGEREVTKKHYVDEIEDLDESAYELLGNRFSRLAKDGNGKDRFRERRANDRQDYYAPVPKVKRARDRHP
jgi:hypothetical protein